VPSTPEPQASAPCWLRAAWLSGQFSPEVLPPRLALGLGGDLPVFHRVDGRQRFARRVLLRVAESGAAELRAVGNPAQDRARPR
jgi:hypothetical protein